MLPLRFEIVLGLFQNLKKILKEEQEEQERAENEQTKAAGIKNTSVNGLSSYAQGYMSNATRNVNLPSSGSYNIPKPSMPSIPHI